MPALPMIITDAGLDAIIDAQTGGTEEVLITEIGLTATPFVMAPTLTALPGEFRRLDTVAGQSVAPNIIHVTAYDPAPVTYSVSGFGLFSDAGVLIAVYSAAVDPVLTKAALATSLFALDIALEADMAAVIAFGDALFLNPPASQTVAGVAKIATDALANAGVNDATIISPKQLRRVLNALIPTGIITQWSGSIASIPAGWLLCDGSNGTPDLRDKFIVGAGGAYAPGDDGGSANHDHSGATAAHQLTAAQMPEHRHLVAAAGVATGLLTGANQIIEHSNSGENSEYSLDGVATEATLGRTSAVGAGEGHEHDIAAASNLPPYFALAYIMKG